MSKRKNFYPTKPKQNNTIEWGKMNTDNKDNDYLNISMLLNKPLVKFNDNAQSQFAQWKKTFKDDWHNGPASLNANNSIIQYSSFITERLSYYECASLATDTTILNAITKKANALIENGGEIILQDDTPNKDETLTKIEERFKSLDVLQKMNDLIRAALTYGRADLFIDVNSKDLSKPFILDEKVQSINPIANLKVVEPAFMSPYDIDMINVLNEDYMKPKSWVIQGASTVHSSRLMSLIPYDIPVLLKPLFNFGGVSLPQLMKKYVRSADSSREAIADLILRFKTDIIKSDLPSINIDKAIERAKAHNAQRNNTGLTYLGEKEEFLQITTPLTNLDKLSAQFKEDVSASCQTPTNLLYGTTPGGLNNTGEFDLDNYYDGLESFQRSKLKPIIEKILHMICLELGLDLKPEYEFNPLKKEDEKLVAEIKEKYIKNANDMLASQLISRDNAIEYLKIKEVIPDNFNVTVVEVEQENSNK